MKLGTFWKEPSASGLSTARWRRSRNHDFCPGWHAHTYRVIEPSRYLIILTPRLDRLIARLRGLSDQTQLRSRLAESDSVMVEQRPPSLMASRPQGTSARPAPVLIP